MVTSVPPGSEPDPSRFAVVLAGGSGRRLGFVDKPALVVAGRTLLDRALRAVAPALTVVVGPARDLPPEVLQVSEQPPHGGPAAGLAAGLGELARHRSRGGNADLVVVLAADLPGIDREAVRSLTLAVNGRAVEGAVLVDPAGRDQYLAGAWRLDALLGAVRTRASWHGARLSDLLGPLVGVRVPADRARSADIDTTADLVEWGGTGPGSGMQDRRRAPTSTGPGDDGVV